MSALEALASAGRELQQALASAGRLHLFAVLGEAGLAQKAVRAKEASRRMEEAARLGELLERHLQLRELWPSWPERLRPDRAGLIEAERAQLERTDALVADCLLDAAALCEEALAAARASDGLEPLIAPLLELQRSLPTASRAARPHRGARFRSATLVMRGPQRVSLDPIFAPAFSLLDERAAKSMDTHRAPHWWCLSTREAMAAELCALTSVEHDGLPLAFHRDLAKQCWDEVRHARLFLRAAIEALPEFLRDAPADHPLRAGAEEFSRTGRGLPAPREGNLYEAIWSCTLEQRLVLMHLDTETPGVGGFVKDLRSDWVRAHPALAEELRVAMHDEASHARFGRKWLHHLFPDDAERAARADEARLFRGIALLAGLASRQERPLPVLVAERLERLPQAAVGA